MALEPLRPRLFFLYPLARSEAERLKIFVHLVDFSSFSRRRRNWGASLRLRGGSWNNNGNNCRSANRNNNTPDTRNNNNGFRVVVGELTHDCQIWREGSCREHIQGVQCAFQRCERLHPKINRAWSRLVGREYPERRARPFHKGGPMKRVTKSSKDLPIIQKTYDLIVWYIPHLNRLPRDHRFMLGDRIITGLYDLLRELILARYEKEKLPRLESINGQLDQLRYQTRLLRDFDLLDLRRYQFVAEKIDEIGRNLGGWIGQQRSLESR